MYQDYSRKSILSPPGSVLCREAFSMISLNRGSTVFDYIRTYVHNSYRNITPKVPLVGL